MATILAHPLALKIVIGVICAAVVSAYAVKRYLKYLNSDAQGNDWM